MKQVALLLLLSASVVAPRLGAQAPVEPAPVAPAPVAPVQSAPATPSLSEQAAQPAPAELCLPSATLDELVKALDEAVSGPANKDRTCLKALMLPEARLAPIAKGPDGAPAPNVQSLDEWIASVRKRGKMAFYERQIKFSSETYGHIAHLWSTYELSLKPGGKPLMRGINSIQAVSDGKRWRVLEILWQQETSSDPVPEKYLP